MHKVFIDSNILLAAIFTELKGSYPSLIINFGNSKFFELYISNLVEIEVRKNLLIKKPEKLPLLEEVLKYFHKLRDIYVPLNEIQNLPEADKIILSTAIYNKMDFFITGNTKDFKHLYGKKIIKTMILKPKEFFEINI
ncbi:PIN domain-containing protein [Thermodesulfovibrio sp. TK110]